MSTEVFTFWRAGVAIHTSFLLLWLSVLLVLNYTEVFHLVRNPWASIQETGQEEVPYR